MSKNKNCQSCGMPLSRDPQGGGSEADGKKSLLYCSYCYQQGGFTEPKITCDQMIEKVRAVLKQMKVPRWMHWFFVRRIHRLDRWNQ